MGKNLNLKSQLIMDKLILRLRRIRIKDKTCDGRLFSNDGIRICDTAEATPYMLRSGEYEITRRCRLLAKGNGVHALKGPTILLGTHLVPGVVKRSAEAYDRLYQRIKKARQRGHKILLVVEGIKPRGDTP